MCRRKAKFPVQSRGAGPRPHGSQRPSSRPFLHLLREAWGWPWGGGQERGAENEAHIPAGGAGGARLLVVGESPKTSGKKMLGERAGPWGSSEAAAAAGGPEHPPRFPPPPACTPGYSSYPGGSCCSCSGTALAHGPQVRMCGSRRSRGFAVQFTVQREPEGHT